MSHSVRKMSKYHYQSARYTNYYLLLLINMYLIVLIIIIIKSVFMYTFIRDVKKV